MLCCYVNPHTVWDVNVWHNVKIHSTGHGQAADNARGAGDSIALNNSANIRTGIQTINNGFTFIFGAINCRIQCSFETTTRVCPSAWIGCSIFRKGLHKFDSTYCWIGYAAMKSYWNGKSLSIDHVTIFNSETLRRRFPPSNNGMVWQPSWIKIVIQKPPPAEQIVSRMINLIQDIC